MKVFSFKWMEDRQKGKLMLRWSNLDRPEGLRAFWDVVSLLLMTSILTLRRKPTKGSDFLKHFDLRGWKLGLRLTHNSVCVHYLFCILFTCLYSGDTHSADSLHVLCLLHLQHTPEAVQTGEVKRWLIGRVGTYSGFTVFYS